MILLERTGSAEPAAESVDDLVEGGSEFLTVGVRNDGLTAIDGEDHLNVSDSLYLGEDHICTGHSGMVFGEALHLVLCALTDGITDAALSCRDLDSQLDPPIWQEYPLPHSAQRPGEGY